MSDVSAAFDRVFVGRLVANLTARGTPPEVLSLFNSCLGVWGAEVAVEGTMSRGLLLDNLMFQGMVWDPMLLPVFYAGSAGPIWKVDFAEIVFAGDLNALRVCSAGVRPDSILAGVGAFHRELHQRDKAIQGSLGAGKESKHILPPGRSRTVNYFIYWGCSLTRSLPRPNRLSTWPRLVGGK